MFNPVKVKLNQLKLKRIKIKKWFGFGNTKYTELVSF